MTSGHNSRPIQILSLIGVNVAYLINLPLVIYCGYRLYKAWNKPFIVKRRRSIILSIIILICFGTLIEYPYYFMENTNSFPIINIIMTVTGFASRCILSALISLRIYLLHYDHQYNRILSKQKWQILIDPALQNNFYLLNRQKYGNHKYIIKFIIIPILIIYFGTFLFSLFLMNDDIAIIFNLSFSSFCFLICAIIGYYYWRSFPNKIHDSFFIRDELKFSIRIYALLAITVAIALIFILWVHAVIPFPLMLISAEIIFTFILYIMILYPARKLQYNNHQTLQQFATINRTATKPKYIGWEKMIETEDGYEQFANFLEEEFSLETILFITEYIQLKNAMMQHSQLKMIIVNELKLLYTLELPESVPLSLISQHFAEGIDNDSDGNIDDIVLKTTKKLYTKYIDSSKAFLEVNISSSIRMQLMDLFKSFESMCDYKVLNETPMNVLQDVLPLLENAVLEISYLINDSYSRFRRTNIFIEVMDQK